jgi:hypothetical protein
LFFLVFPDLDMVGVTGSIPVPPTNPFKRLPLSGLDADTIKRQSEARETGPFFVAAGRCHGQGRGAGRARHRHRRCAPAQAEARVAVSAPAIAAGTVEIAPAVSVTAEPRQSFRNRSPSDPVGARPRSRWAISRAGWPVACLSCRQRAWRASESCERPFDKSRRVDERRDRRALAVGGNDRNDSITLRVQKGVVGMAFDVRHWAGPTDSPWPARLRRLS